MQNTLPSEQHAISELENRSFRYGFLLGDDGFLAPKDIFCEVIEKPAINLLPNTQVWFKGLITIRGKLVPVFDLAAMLGLQRQNKTNLVFALRLKQNECAFLIDSAHSLDESEIVEQAKLESVSDRFKSYAETVGQYGQQVWVDFNFNKCLEEFREKIPA